MGTYTYVLVSNPTDLVVLSVVGKSLASSPQFSTAIFLKKNLNASSLNLYDSEHSPRGENVKSFFIRWEHYWL